MKMTRSARAYALGLVAVLAVATAFPVSEDSPQLDMHSLKEFRIERVLSDPAKSCIDCHSKTSSGIVADWARSRHAHAGVTCLDCHAATVADGDASGDHLEYTKTRISPIVSPKDCSRCHPQEAAEYTKSKHANTLEIIWKIDPWLNAGMNNEIERVTGCYHCHGSVVKVADGQFDPQTWPNVGVGRLRAYPNNPEQRKVITAQTR